MTLGIVFEQLSGNDLSYKIRLHHEVGSQNTWDTDRVGPEFEIPGPRAQELRYFFSILREGVVIFMLSFLQLSL